MKKESKKNKKSMWKFQLLIFILLFISAELIMRMTGMKPGVLEDQFYQAETIIIDQSLYGDEMGITHTIPGKETYPGQNTNLEGFPSSIEYTKAAMDSIRSLGKKIVFLIGDSYTYGCCPGNLDYSFAGLLTNSEKYEVLNFGIGGTDPLQYALIVKKYAPILEPDLVVIIPFLGNDILQYDRTPKPNIPICYTPVNGPWISSEAPTHYYPVNTSFETAEKAKGFYYTYYSLRSDQNTFFEKLIRESIILSRVYLFLKISYQRYKLGDKAYTPQDKPEYSYNHLKEIQSFCDSINTNVVYTGIPSYTDVLNKINPRIKYDFLFEDIPWVYPKNITTEDYDFPIEASHYLQSGHRKFSIFLNGQILNHLDLKP
ncbi:MAG: hypothetical protein ACI837_002463 [Crocinitomicaceae bacterium]|jgi:hypothetical protein